MLTSKLEIFQRPILCQEDTAISVIKSACILHNFIKFTEGKFSIPQIVKDNPRRRNPLANIPPINQSTYELRDYLKSYFLNLENALPWQGKV